MISSSQPNETRDCEECQRDEQELLVGLLGCSSASDALDNFEIDSKQLASGSCAAIHLGRDRRRTAGKVEGIDGYVFKVFFPFAEKSEEQISPVRAELTALLKVPQHPNILRYFNAFWLDDAEGRESALRSRWALQFEYCSGGDLHAVTSKNIFTEVRAQSVVKDVLQALLHLNSHDLVHRDVKPENILMQSNGTCKLADFGLCTSILDDEEMKKRCGTPGYCAPEVWLGQRYGIQVDSFSVGAVLYFMMSGKILFFGRDLSSIMRRTVRCDADLSRSRFFANCTQSCRDFLSSLLMKSPDIRPSPKLALRNPWIVRVSFDDPLSSAKEEIRRISTWSSGVTAGCSTRVSSDLGNVDSSLEQGTYESFGRRDSDGWPHVDSRADLQLRSPQPTQTTMEPGVQLAQNLLSVFSHPLGAPSAPDCTSASQDKQHIVASTAVSGSLSVVKPVTARCNPFPHKFSYGRSRTNPPELDRLCEMVSQGRINECETPDDLLVRPPSGPPPPKRNSGSLKLRNLVKADSAKERDEVVAALCG